METAALLKAIEAAGGQSALARQLREMTGKPIGQGHIWSWLNRTGAVPPEYAIPIEQITGVSRHDIRPDIYPRESGQHARAVGA